MNPIDMQNIQVQIDSALLRVTDWERQHDPNLDTHGGRAWSGTCEGWRFLVVDFDTEAQGFPAGSRGYDGTATHAERSIICRLTREQAKRAVEAALR